MTVELRAGAARADMTPEPGIPLAGFWRPRPAKGIDTPLSSHALVLDDGDSSLAFVAVDLIALLGSDVDAAKKGIRRETGIRPERIMVACSHTHEAPYPCPLLGKETHAEPDYIDSVIHAIVESATSACAGMVPAEVGFGSTRVPGLGENRRRLKGPRDAFNVWQLAPEERGVYPPAGPVDDELVMLAVRRRSGEPLAVLWNYALHAHVFASDRISADYPYHVWQQMARALHPKLTSLYMPGACGDTNRAPSVESKAIVDRLSEALIHLYGNLQFSSWLPMHSRLEPIRVKLRDFSTFQEEEIRRKQESSLVVCRQEWEILREAAAKTIGTVLQAMAIGSLGFAAVPGEYFTALGLGIKRGSPFATTAVVELANDYVGYIPTSEAFDQGGYELFNARSSKVARGTGELMADELVDMLSQFHRLDQRSAGPPTNRRG